MPYPTKIDIENFKVPKSEEELCKLLVRPKQYYHLELGDFHHMCGGPEFQICEKLTPENEYEIFKGHLPCIALWKAQKTNDFHSKATLVSFIYWTRKNAELERTEMVKVLQTKISSGEPKLAPENQN